jgi:hypothetical protein
MFCSVFGLLRRQFQKEILGPFAADPVLWDDFVAMEEDIDKTVHVDVRLKMRDLVNFIQILVGLTHSCVEVGKVRIREPELFMDQLCT